MTLSPTGAAILDRNDRGVVTGHPAAMARLRGDGFVVTRNGTHRITPAGRAALRTWREEHGGTTPSPDRAIPRKLPGRQHEALMTAAHRPDHRVPGRDDSDVYRSGQPWFRQSTLRAIYQAGYADIRPAPEDKVPMTWEQTGRSLYLTPAGRNYIRLQGNLAIGPRRVVIIACGSTKRPALGGGPGYPAGELYTGGYHRHLRQAADALTDQSLIFINSALHGLVPLTRKLHPYDVRPGDEQAISSQRLASHTAELGLDDAHVIFLGGAGYALKLTPSIPHLLTPLSGGIGSHKRLCVQVSADPSLRAAWWGRAAELFDEAHPGTTR
ncbi:DUF6884 domain-containing protein [Streptomyces sp. NPDC053474]|uniref:DUF6884 domain-containing protein n=1 Tax=Streptomyces sp. NPDC053474 TaxID=3365704 RepID=UPI0037D48F29